MRHAQVCLAAIALLSIIVYHHPGKSASRRRLTQPIEFQDRGLKRILYRLARPEHVDEVIAKDRVLRLAQGGMTRPTVSSRPRRRREFGWHARNAAGGSPGIQDENSHPLRK
jgi:hypothetical protein